MSKITKDAIEEVCYRLVYLAESCRDLSDEAFSTLEKLGTLCEEIDAEDESQEAEAGNPKEEETEGEAIAIELLKAVFECLAEVCEEEHLKEIG